MTFVSALQRFEARHDIGDTFRPGGRLLRGRCITGLRMCKDGRCLEAKLTSFAKGFLKKPHMLPIFKVVYQIFKVPIETKGRGISYFIYNSRFRRFRNFSSLSCSEQMKDARTKHINMFSVLTNSPYISYQCQHLRYACVFLESSLR